MTLAIGSVAADNSVTNTQEIAVDCGGQVPVGCIVMVTRGVTDGARADGAMMSVGWTDGTNVRTASMMAEDNVLASAPADSSRGMSDANIVYILNTTTGALQYAASFAGFSNDVVKLLWGAAPLGVSYLVKVMAFYGGDVEVAAGAVASSTTQGGTATVSGLSFRPKAVLFIGGEFGFATGVNTHARQHIACATFDESNNVTGQWMVAGGDREGGATQIGITQTATITATRDDAVGCRYNIGATSTGPISLLSQVRCSAGSSSGFTLTTDEPASPSVMVLGYMALRFGTRDALAFISTIAQLDTTVADVYELTNTGWTPNTVICAGGHANALNTYLDSGAGGGHAHSLGGANSNEAAVCGVSMADAKITSDTRSITGTGPNIAAVMNDGAGLGFHYVLALDSFLAEGFGVEVTIAGADGVSRYPAFLAIQASNEELITNESVVIGDSQVLFAGIFNAEDLGVVENVMVGDDVVFDITALSANETVVIGDAAQLADTTAIATESVVIRDILRLRGEGIGAIVDEGVVIGDSAQFVFGDLLEASEGVVIGDSVNFGAGTIPMQVGSGRGKVLQAGAEMGSIVQAGSLKGRIHG